MDSRTAGPLAEFIGAGRTSPPSEKPRALSQTRIPAQLIAALQLLASVSIVLLISLGTFYLHLSLAVTAFLLFLVIVVTALQLGFWQATITSLAGVFFLDYLFTAPIYSLKTDSTGVMALTAFEFAALVVSRLSAQVQLHSRIADEQRRNMERLYELARQVLLVNRKEPVGLQIARFVRETIKVDSVAVLEASTLDVHALGEYDAFAERAARNCWLAEKNSDNPAEQTSARLLRIDGRNIGALGFHAKHLSPIVVDAVASIAAIAIERSRALEKETRAEAARQSDQLRTAVLDALAHAFKTPLTTILAASSGLLESGELQPAQKELAQLIDDQSVVLNDLTTRLLQTARLESVRMKVRRDEFTLAELIERLLEPFHLDFSQRAFRIDVPQETIHATGDRELLTTALHQVVDNALKYSDAGSPVTIRAVRSRGEIMISVHNQGTPIHAQDRERIFDRFYRSPGTQHKAAGTGLGLSVTKKIAEAHRGRVWAANDETGPTIYFVFPANGSENSTRQLEELDQ